ncbi:MAG: AAA family ATPase [Nitrospira sp. CR1.3]|nr:AAA family ATPase [Nitrospira sp. CR1.3]
MTATVAQLRDRLASYFQGVEQVDDAVLRFTRSVAQRPFAIYYVDVSDHLPATPAELTSYQDRIIGKRYFDGSKSLQWSNYLFFVVSEALRNVPLRQLIEQDRTYARKFVVTEDELESAVEPLKIATTDATPETNVLSVWTEQLEKAGLDAAVLSKEPLPQRLSLIETTKAPAKAKSKPTTSSRVSADLAQLRSLVLSKYRNFPTTRSFELGIVNLIVGANGTGKTSLLEAIELLYCGKTKRNPQADDKYEIIAQFVDGQSEKATSSRAMQVFRDRNLAWYGQAEIKTCNLYLGFAQFNFLDTDAAVSLSDSISNLEDDLSKLLVGPEASQAWKEIERMSDAVAGRLRELRPSKSLIDSEMTALEARIKESQSVPQESDAIFARLEEMMHRHDWSVPETGKEAVAVHLIESFTELESLTQQAVLLETTVSPVSIAGLQQFCTEADHTCNKVDSDILRLEQMKKDERRLASDAKRLQLATRLAVEAERIAAAALPSRLAELQRHRTVIATTSNVVADIDENLLAQLKIISPATTIPDHLQSVAASAAAAERARSAAKDEYKQFTELRNKSANLAQQLRSIAAQLLESSPNPDLCPLCHTQFEKGQLDAHIHMDVDATIEARAQSLLSQVQAREEQLHVATVALAAATTIANYASRARIAQTSPLGVVVESIALAQQTLDEARRRAAAIESEVKVLQSQGLSEDRVIDVQNELGSAGYPLTEWSQDSIVALNARIGEDVTTNKTALDKQRQATDQLQRSMATILKVSADDVSALRAATSQLKEQRTLVASFLERIRELLVLFPWGSDRPMTELRLAVESIRTIAAELQAAVAREHQARTLSDESIKRKNQLTKQLADLNKRIAQFDRAQEVLNTLTTQHSLAGAMSAALLRNRASIESIFCRIHAPAEFTGLGSTFTTLVRKAGGVEAKLSQISTGQRAAFALSIFLAQNAQLRAAPPVVLIDDPIAHVDDLNALSFLDYLRELALAGNKQILFATANEKLATLFERKFDFLGDGFRRHDLRR